MSVPLHIKFRGCSGTVTTGREGKISTCFLTCSEGQTRSGHSGINADESNPGSNLMPLLDPIAGQGDLMLMRARTGAYGATHG